jgi:hypothetical protein
MAPNAKVRIEFELSAEQRKLLELVATMEKIPASEVCRVLLLNHLNSCRDAASTGVLPHLPHLPMTLPPPKRRPPPPKVVRGPDQYQMGR